MSQHPFQLFINLVTFDQETRALTAAIEQEKKTLEQLESDIRKLHQALENKKQVVLDLRKTVDNAELEMKTLDTQEKTKKEVLEGVSDHKEYTALQSEIERVQRAQVEQEQRVVAAWNKLENAQEDFEVLKKDAESDIDRLKKEIEQKAAAIRVQQEAITTRADERNDKLAQVPEEWLEKYEMMQSRVADPVVPVEGNSCTSCFTMLTDADLNRIQKGALLQCKSCYRLLYSPEVMKNGN